MNESEFEKIQREFDKTVETEHLWDTYIKSLSPEKAVVQDREWVAHRAEEIRASNPPQPTTDEGWVPCKIGSVYLVRSGDYTVPVGSSYDRAQAVANKLNGLK